MPKTIFPNTGPNQTLPPGKRPCPFCKAGIAHISWQDLPTLSRFTDYFGNIKKRRYTGVCLRHQKRLTKAIEHARFMSMLAYRK